MEIFQGMCIRQNPLILHSKARAFEFKVICFLLLQNEWRTFQRMNDNVELINE